MAIATTTHLNFRGTARAALDFYAGVFGGGPPLAVTYRDAKAVSDPAEADQIMWGQVTADGFRIMAYDVPGRLPYDPGTIPFFVSIRGSDAAEIAALWERLAAGASIVAPLAPAGWSPLYGMLKDRFGVNWVLDAEPPYAG